jgi:hypothetical protein
METHLPIRSHASIWKWLERSLLLLFTATSLTISYIAANVLSMLMNFSERFLSDHTGTIKLCRFKWRRWWRRQQTHRGINYRWPTWSVHPIIPSRWSRWCSLLIQIQMYDQNLRKIPLLAVSTQLPSMLSCLRRLQSINHTIENQSPQMIQQITTLQIPQQHDMETIRQSIEGFSLLPFTESEDLYDSDSDGDNTACHSLYVLHRRINCSSPDVPTTSIVPSTPTVHWSTEIPAAPRWHVRH